MKPIIVTYSNESWIVDYSFGNAFICTKLGTKESDMCIGIDHCSKKNCTEQEICLFPEQKAIKKVKINQCQIHKKFCSNVRSCEILGQCILDHPLVKNDKMASKQLRKPLDISRVVKIVSRLMPSLNRNHKRFNKKNK